ncbi:cell wall-binding repeat-containing protein [Agrococcus sp. ProA11]|uniref:cell wall-binding repeat-containing protein n=1 Tax=Agrococcus chionoecetis TaxID=3153752 RepID=UPI00326198F1
MLRRRPLVAIVAVIAMLSGVVAATPATPAEAVSASDFTPGNLISDANFFDGKALTASQTQTFLEQRRPSCTTGYTCLRDYRQATPAMTGTQYCDAMPGQSNERASSIIGRVGQACDISQRVLLVLLEKEQSLVTTSRPSSTQYERATGFACPDTAPCDPSFGGFFYQVYNAARQFQRYAMYPSNYQHRVGVRQVLYHPNAACGSSAVNIENQATAGLYNYTPYQPNKAALANMYGTGDSCSAYGNRNFWRIFTDWFGDPRGAGSGPPIGAVDASATTYGLQATLSGWAFDPDTTSPIRVHVYANNPYPQGRNVGTLIAEQQRADIPARTPGNSDRFGFSGTLTVPSGTTRLCVHALDSTVHGSTMIGCVEVTPKAGTPIGQIDSTYSVGSTAFLRGWAHDPDSKSPIRVHIYRGGPLGVGKPQVAADADLPRPDVQRAVSTAGAAHGYEIAVPAPVGGETYCAYAINVEGGDHRMIGCRDVEPRGGPPSGAFEAIERTSTGDVVLTGWAVDPSTSASSSVRVSVAGRDVGTYVASVARSDVASSYPGYGAAHGFRVQLQLGAGEHRVCVTALDHTGGDPATSLGCRTVSVTLASLMPSADRISGANRFLTSVAVSKDSFPSTAPVVYLASGTSFPDGLSAGPAAAHDGGPVLLTPAGSVPQEVLAEIRRLKPQEIVIVGGTPSVSAAAEQQVRGLGVARTVVRLNGANRFETSRMVAEHAFGRDADAVFLATGLRFPDALAAGPAAALRNGPVLLVNGTAAAPDAATRATIAALRPSYIGVVGNASSISTGMEQAVRAGGVTVERFAGDNRFETAAELGRLFGDVDSVLVASGEGFADALPGAAAAGAAGSPLLLSHSTCVPVPTGDRLAEWRPGEVILLGGVPTLGADVASYRSCG